MLVLGAALTVLHSAAIPAPVLHRDAPGEWRALHILADDCDCSKSVADRLASRGRLPNWREDVIVIGRDPVDDTSLTTTGFTVQHLTADDAARAGFQGAPWLVLRDPAGRVVYSGGYTAARPAPGQPTQETKIMQSVRGGQTVNPLPAFGCATSQNLRRQLDPLHLAY